MAVEDVMGVAGNIVPPPSSSTSTPASGSSSGAPSAAPKTDSIVLESDAPRKPIRGYVDGCFDIMHSGHYNAIRQAKMLCDVLVAGVHSDEEIQRNKGPPVLRNEERLATVRACKWVDEVVFGTPYQPSLELLDQYDCDFGVHGDDMPVSADGTDAYAEIKNAGRLRVIKRTEGVSTTDLVGRLLLMTKDHHTKTSVTAGLTSPVLSPRGSEELGSLSSTIPGLTLSPSPASGPQSASGTPVVAELKLGARMESPTSGRDTPTTPAAAAPEPVEAPEDEFRSGMSSMMTTAWRIAQFSNHRTPSPGDVVVYVDGAFDLFHIGHIATLEKARALGDFLYVGVHDDATVNRHKGGNYPIMSMHERVLNVLSCKFVDEVVIAAPWDVSEELIKTLNIQIMVTGTNTKVHGALNVDTDPYAAPKALGLYREVDTSAQLSTSDVIGRIIENRLAYEKRNRSRAKKEKEYLEDREYVAEL